MDASEAAPPAASSASSASRVDLDLDRVTTSNGAVSRATCAACHQSIVDQYFEIGGKTACARCKASIEQALSSGSGGVRFARAAGAATLAAALGATGYYVIGSTTGHEFVLGGLLLGLMVGGAVRWGARRRGGWVYQSLAMFMTYVAIAAAHVPFLMDGFMEGASRQHVVSGSTRRARSTTAPEAASQSEVATPPADQVSQGAHAQSVKTAPTETNEPSTQSATQPPDEVEDIDDVADTDAKADGSAHAQVAAKGFASRHPFVTMAMAGIGMLALAAIAPFVTLTADPAQGAIGLFIIAIALYQAWRMNKRLRLAFSGPYRVRVADGDSMSTQGASR